MIKAEKGPGRPRGRRPVEDALSREQIISAALLILAEKGLEAFSVRDLAKALDVYPAAIYWHIPTKNGILAEVVAYALRDMVPPTDAGIWQDWLRALFVRYREAVRAHPIIAPLLGANIVSNAGVGPSLIEKILGVLNKAGFAEDNIVDAFNVVIAAKVGFVTLELAAMPEDDKIWAEAMRNRINTVNVADHPLLARYLPLLSNRAFMLRWENGTQVPLESSFEAYVDVVIGGLETLLKQGRKRRRQ